MRTCTTILVLLVLLAVRAAAEDRLWDRIVQPHWEMVLTNGESRYGEVVDVDEDNGTVRFRSLGSDGVQAWTRSTYTELRKPRLAHDIIEHNGRILVGRPFDANNEADILNLVEWAIEEGAADAAHDLLEQAGLAFADQSGLAATLFLEQVVKRLQAAGDRADGIERVVRAGLAGHPDWRRGYNLLFDLLHRTGRQAELDQAVDQALAAVPDHLQANAHKAAQLVESGDLATARDAFRLASARGDTAAQLGYAYTSLMLGEETAALSAARRMIDEGVFTHEARAIAGSVLLLRDKAEEARPHLVAATDNGLGGRLGDFARYNLGLLRLRDGDRAAALALWRGIDGPAAEFARAVAQGREVPDRLVASDPELAARARQHNATIALTRPEPDLQAFERHIDGDEGMRATFLRQVAELLATRGDELAVRSLALSNSPESLRWQAYGHLLAGRLDQAWEVLERLPDDDGYAATYRVYLLAARGEEAGARKVYREQVEPLATGRKQASAAPPRTYVGLLAAEFEASEGQFRRIDFDWPDGEVLGTGWDSEARGTGIRIAVDRRRLVFAGTQQRTRSPVSRAWCAVRQDRLEKLVLDLDRGAVGKATVGLEILDRSLDNGVAVGIRPDHTLAWRQLERGRWGRWTPFDAGLVHQDGKPLVVLYRGRGRVGVPDPDPLVLEPFAAGKRFSVEGHIVVSIFGEAPEGEAWRLAARRLDIQ